MNEITFNLNQYFKVKLKLKGVFHFMNEYNQYLPADMRQPIEFFTKQADQEGYTKFQAWEFIKMFGNSIRMWEQPIFDTNIKIIHDEKV